MSIVPDGLHLLTNGSYRVAIDGAGAGGSRWRQFEVTRWREDPVRNPWGLFLMLADVGGGQPWSAGLQPFPEGDDAVASIAGDGVARFERRHGDIGTTLEVAVHPDHDAELRHLVIENHGTDARELVLTTYLEAVIGPGGPDASHPAYSKMFVQTHWDAARGVLLATRRRRAAKDSQPWCAQSLVAIDGDGTVRAGATGLEFETDRRRFLGRGRTLRNALAMLPGATLAGTTGCVLDPVMSLRRRITLAAGARAELALWTVMAESRDAAVAVVDALQVSDAVAATLSGAAEFARAARETLGVSAADARRFDAIAAALRQSDASHRAAPDQLLRGRGGAPALWGAGISGDRPIMLLSLAAQAPGTDDALTTAFAAQRYWQAQGLAADLVVLAPGDAGAEPAWTQRVQAQSAALEPGKDLVPSAVFLLDAATLAPDLRDGLWSVARVVLDGTSGWPAAATSDGASTAAGTAGWSAAQVVQTPRRLSGVELSAWKSADTQVTLREFDNGWGGFSADGASYSIHLQGDDCTPSPWSNVVANAQFGFLLTAEGGGYSWSVNSQQNALTPWPNDPVSDVPRDTIYLRDLDDGALWSASASPARAAGGRYRTEHGKGFSRLHAAAHGIASDLLLLVPVDDPVKIGRLRLRNDSGRTRRLSVTAYVQWSLGANGTVPAPHVSTACDSGTGALLARNTWRPDFADRIAFLDLGGCQQSATGDRREFLGPLGEEARPAALLRGGPLSGRVGAGLDPCAALQCEISLAPGEGVELLTLLGDADSADHASALVSRYRTADIDAVLAAATGLWRDLLDTVQVRTPDRAMDVLLNHWLPYQVLACRVWARTAYYQASGAFGFRDQLQDVTSLCLSRPDLARAHILRATARQFTEGDVQHWWQPPSGTGVRTRMTDDLLWLPYVAMHYIGVTGDQGILDEVVPYVSGDVLKPGEDERYFRPEISPRTASVYQHAAETIDRSLSLGVGAHGLPLIGTGDWNDGMNAVGEEGHGESVWLAWLQLSVIDVFAPVAEARGEGDRAAHWRTYADTLATTLDSPSAWDGDWYRRGYYDDGTPLGSASSLECQIDTIAQSWSVMSGRADPGKAARAMESVHERLTWVKERVAPLFTPPFDDGPTNPGYIKGYPPGIRENGGQYTHGSCWAVFAWAALGRGERASELFDIFNPILHATNAEDAMHYQVEPYVACADVYSVPPYVGRGGWTWYTGSSGWVYRAGIEAVLGFHRKDGRLVVDPCIRSSWPGFELTYRHRGDGDRVTVYDIAVENPDGVEKGVLAIEVDGVAQRLDAVQAPGFAVIDDGATHRVRVRMGRA